jgi:hypothetical protein
VSTKLKLGRRTVEVSNPDKPFFPDDGLTKSDLISYYRRIGDTMLPYLKDRPATLHRFPDGIEGDDFYQQQRPDHLPDWVRGVELPRRSGGTVNHTVIDSVAALVVVANTGCITPHLWLSRVGEPERPDQLVFDLDHDVGGVDERAPPQLVLDVGADLPVGSGRPPVPVLEPVDDLDHSADPLGEPLRPARLVRSVDGAGERDHSEHRFDFGVWTSGTLLSFRIRVRSSLGACLLGRADRQDPSVISGSIGILVVPMSSLVSAFSSCAMKFTFSSPSARCSKNRKPETVTPAGRTPSGSAERCISVVGSGMSCHTVAKRP